MSQRKLKQQLIRLGNQEPSLRDHLRAVLDALTTKTAAKIRNAAAPYGSDESKWEIIESEYDDNYLPAVIKLRKATDKMVGSFSHIDMGLSDNARNALDVFHDLRDAFSRVERFKRERNASKLRDTLNEILQAKKDRIGRGNDIHQVSSDFRTSGYSALENAADSVPGVFNAAHRMLQKAKRIQ